MVAAAGPGKEGNLYAEETKEQDWSFNVVGVKSINLDSVKFVKITKLESKASQSWTQIVYKVDTGANGNLMLLNIFKTLFPRFTLNELYATKIMP